MAMEENVEFSFTVRGCYMLIVQCGHYVPDSDGAEHGNAEDSFVIVQRRPIHKCVSGYLHCKCQYR